MWNELKKAPLTWRLTVFVGIPIAAIFACGTIGVLGYLVIARSPNQTQPAAQEIAADIPPTEPPPSEVTASPLPPTATPPPTPPTPTPSEVGYVLDWNIEEDQPVAYNTAMEVSECCTSIDYDRIFNFGQADEDTDLSSHFEEMFEDIRNNQPTYSIVSILEKKPDGNIAVKMVLDHVEAPEPAAGASPEESMAQWYGQMLKGMEGSVQLQGDITPEGEIASPYIAPQQKNLLALFFELPVGPVNVGDTWQIDLTCLTLNSAQFEVESSNRVNQVTLQEVTVTPEDEPVAVLDYLIAESVEGDQTIPFFSSEPVPTTMKCSFVGRGEFLIDQGRWRAFSAENRLQSTGVVTSDVTQQLALTPLDEVPDYPEPDLQDQPSFPDLFSERQAIKVCQYAGQEVIGENTTGTISIDSYLPAGEEVWDSSKSIVLQVANIDPPEEMTLNGEDFVRNPLAEAVGELPSLPIDSSQASDPVIRLILTSSEEEIEETVTLSFAGQEYQLTLDDALNETCR